MAQECIGYMKSCSNDADWEVTLKCSPSRYFCQDCYNSYRHSLTDTQVAKLDETQL